MELDLDTDEETENTDMPEITKAYNEIDCYKEKRLDINEDLMTYWKQKKYVAPYLTKLAKIVHAVPAT